ncbi:hypothetical protein N183_12060 [Sinorhizobium sp. Sb3]|nr:hypothetical protein N183_12060 [Sinorhizobium sp. Sb3]
MAMEGTIMKLIKLAAAALILFGSATYVSAHSGGTDENGCHTNHKTGGYHCH